MEWTDVLSTFNKNSDNWARPDCDRALSAMSAMKVHIDRLEKTIKMTEAMEQKHKSVIFQVDDVIRKRMMESTCEPCECLLAIQVSKLLEHYER